MGFPLTCTNRPKNSARWCGCRDCTERNAGSKQAGFGKRIRGNLFSLLRKIYGTLIEHSNSQKKYRDYRTGDELATAINDISPSRRVYRSELLDMLLKPLPKERLHTGKQLVRIEERGLRRAAIFKDDTEAVADLIIGADGIKSEVRKALGGIA